MWAFIPSIVIGILLLVILTLLGRIYGYATLIYGAVGVLVVYIIYLIFVIREFRVKTPPPKVVEKSVIKEIEKVKEIVKPDIEEEDFIILKDYIKYNLHYGHSKEEILNKVLSAGWKKEKIELAFSEVGDISPLKNKEKIGKQIQFLAKHVQNTKNQNPKR